MNKNIVAFLLVCCSLSLSAQIKIDTAHSAAYLVNDVLLGSGVLAGNIEFTGKKYAIGIYSDSSRQMGLDAGIVLTSGNAFYVKGPNKSPRSGWASNSAGDTDLDKIARGKTYDASVLEFDFITTSENLSFQYVFASEEYLEYVGSKFNDVFAFFIEGPGLEKVNIATLPDDKTPITVNTINNKLNKKYYLDNTFLNTTDLYVWDVRKKKVVENKYYLTEEIPPKYDVQFDGFTTVLEARCKVIPNEVYHIKIAISDVGDGILDSGVFLKAGSFNSRGEKVTTISKRFEDTKPLKPLKKIVPEIVLENKVKTRHIPKRTNIGIVEFEFDKYNLSIEAYNSIKKIYAQWKETPEAKIELWGHTDNDGSHTYNEELSKNRSQSVANALVSLGVPEGQLVVAHFGENLPLRPNNTTFGRARNRRVEVTLIL